MSVNLSDTKIDAFGANYQTMLGRLQGNILKGHGRDFTVHFFVRFQNGYDLRTQLRGLTQTYVTSARQQRDETEDFRNFQIPGSLFGNLFLTAAGLKVLGLATDDLNDEFFAEGLKARGVQDFQDPAVADWDPGFQGDIHAMLLLADDDRSFLLRQARTALTRLQGFCDILDVEHGHALRNEVGEGIEHFGYIDGRSQPIYFRQDWDADGTKAIWQPEEPLSQVLVPDPLVGAVKGDETDAFGSYFVFRKLEQDVRGFKKREQDLADALGLSGSARELAGALVVGRFEDGTPVTLQLTNGRTPAKDNDFDYSSDTSGQKCPFQGHIRKTNPRGDTLKLGATIAQERAHRITRRGITYGERPAHPQDSQSLEELPSSGVGLLFMCFGSGIANQFAFMQASWANNENFVNPATGTDPVIGQFAPGTPPASQKWSSTWDGPANTSFPFADFVHLKGGEFFYAPSLEFLLHL